MKGFLENIRVKTIKTFVRTYDDNARYLLQTFGTFDLLFLGDVNCPLYDRNWTVNLTIVHYKMFSQY